MYAGGFWLARGESIDACAERLATFLEGLATCDPSLAAWYEPVGTKRIEPPRIDASDSQFLRNLLDRHRRQDARNVVAEELGFKLDLWNGAPDDDDQIGIGITCGASSAQLCNSVIIDFPDDLGPFADADKMSQVLAVLVRAWNPDWAQVACESAPNLQPLVHGKLSVDWMLYLCRDRCPHGATLHHPARLIALGGRLGVITITQDEPPDCDIPEHAANVEAARRALGL
jgi:hypothetical protein